MAAAALEIKVKVAKAAQGLSLLAPSSPHREGYHRKIIHCQSHLVPRAQPSTSGVFTTGDICIVARLTLKPDL